MKYDIEADWLLLSTCNYTCHYCYRPVEKLRGRIRVAGSIERIAGFFNESGLTWLLHITGGEPLVYPGFVELCQELTRQHVMSLNSNVSLGNIVDFARTVPPERVNFVHCGLHIEQRERRNAVADFIKHVSLLQDCGFRVMVSCVMYPDLFDRFEADFRFFGARELVLIPKALQGPYRGKLYPDSYTPDQRQAFLSHSLRAEEHLTRLGTKISPPPTIDLFLDRNFVQRARPDYRGRLCNAGHTFVRIRENGDIRRCGPRDVLGNVVDRVFDRRTGPSVCNEFQCPYFCARYVVFA